MNEDELFGRLDDVLAPQGFRRHKRETFRRLWAGGFDSIVPMTVRYPGEMKLDFSLNIRHDDVEMLLARLEPTPPRLPADTTTTITHMGDMKRKGAMGDLHFRLLTRDALAPALKVFATFLRGAGAAHFQSLRDPVVVERAFNADPTAPTMHCQDEIGRVLRGITLASLYRRAELDVVADAYRDRFVRAWHPVRLVPRFEAVLAGLRAEPSEATSPPPRR